MTFLDASGGDETDAVEDKTENVELNDERQDEALAPEDTVAEEAVEKEHEDIGKVEEAQTKEAASPPAEVPENAEEGEGAPEAERYPEAAAIAPEEAVEDAGAVTPETTPAVTVEHIDAQQVAQMDQEEATQGEDHEHHEEEVKPEAAHHDTEAAETNDHPDHSPVDPASIPIAEEEEHEEAAAIPLPTSPHSVAAALPEEHPEETVAPPPAVYPKEALPKPKPVRSRLLETTASMARKANPPVRKPPVPLAKRPAERKPFKPVSHARGNAAQPVTSRVVSGPTAAKPVVATKPTLAGSTTSKPSVPTAQPAASTTASSHEETHAPPASKYMTLAASLKAKPPVPTAPRTVAVTTQPLSRTVSGSSTQSRTVSSTRQHTAHVPKPPVPRVVSKGSTQPATETVKSATVPSTATARPTVRSVTMPVKHEKVRRKAPLPSFRPVRSKDRAAAQAAAEEGKAHARAEALPLPSSPVAKAKLPLEVPLPSSPVRSSSPIAHVHVRRDNPASPLTVTTARVLSPVLTRTIQSPRRATFASPARHTSDAPSADDIPSPFLNAAGLPINPAKFHSRLSPFPSSRSKVSTEPPSSEHGSDDEDEDDDGALLGVSSRLGDTTPAKSRSGGSGESVTRARVRSNDDRMSIIASPRPAQGERRDVSTPIKGAETLLAKIAGLGTPKVSPATRVALGLRDDNRATVEVE